MKKKIILLILIISFVLLSCESAFALHIEKQNSKIDNDFELALKDKNVIDKNNQDFGYVFDAFGPVNKITNIDFIDGPEDKISRLNSLLSRKLLFPLFSTVIVTNLTFTISFDEPIESRSDYRNWYGTGFRIIDDPEDITTTMNMPHSCTVYDFSGIFKFQRPKIFKFLSIGPKFIIPYRFILLGYSENVILNID